MGIEFPAEEIFNDMNRQVLNELRTRLATGFDPLQMAGVTLKIVNNEVVLDHSDPSIEQQMVEFLSEN